MGLIETEAISFEATTPQILANKINKHLSDTNYRYRVISSILDKRVTVDQTLYAAIMIVEKEQVNYFRESSINRFDI